MCVCFECNCLFACVIFWDLLCKFVCVCGQLFNCVCFLFVFSDVISCVRVCVFLFLRVCMFVCLCVWWFFCRFCVFTL